MNGDESGASSNLALIEMLFAFGVVLALALWQLWDVRPSKVNKENKESPPDD